MEQHIFTWPHKDVSRNVLGEIRRYIDNDGNKKDLPFYIPTGTGGFNAGTTDEMKNSGNPLFGLETVVDKTNPIVICEGQKCASAFHGLGFQCVTSISGASNAAKADWKPLDGAKEIYFFPDNDVAGEKYIKDVWVLLNSFRIPPEMKIVKLPNQENKDDVCDWLKQQPELKDWSELDSLANHPAKEIVLDRLQKTISASLVSIPLEWSDWPETKPLQRVPPPADDFPVDALGDLLSCAAKKIAEVIQAPLAICAQSILASAALAAQRIANIEIDGRISPISEFFLTVGESGERKSAVDNIALNPHSEYQAELNSAFDQDVLDWKRNSAAYEAAKKDALSAKQKSYKDKVSELQKLGNPPEKPLEPFVITEEPTYEGLVKLLEVGQPSMGLFSDEGGRFLGGYACNSENLLKTAAGLCGLWDGKPISRVRGADGASLLPGRRVSFHLMAQPNIAQMMLSNSLLLEQGLLSRCLVTWPISTVGGRSYRGTNLYNTAEIISYKNKIDSILKEKPSLKEGKNNQLALPNITLSTNAKKLFVEFHNQIEPDLQEGGKLNAVKGIANKAPEHAARLAGILAIIDDPKCTEIDQKQMASGIKLMTFYLNEALRLFDAGFQNADLLNADLLLRWLKENDKSIITCVEIYQYGPNQIRDAETTRKLMNILVDHGRAKSKENIIFDGKKRTEGWEVKID